jgi:hypothetical protein
MGAGGVCGCAEGEAAPCDARNPFHACPIECVVSAVFNRGFIERGVEEGVHMSGGAEEGVEITRLKVVGQHEQELIRKCGELGDRHGSRAECWRICM